MFSPLFNALTHFSFSQSQWSAKSDTLVMHKVDQTYYHILYFFFFFGLNQVLLLQVMKQLEINETK